MFAIKTLKYWNFTTILKTLETKALENILMGNYNLPKLYLY